MEGATQGAYELEAAYELALDDGREKVVAADELIDVGDALVFGHEIWLVLRRVERRASDCVARFECRVALQLDGHDLMDYVAALRLKFTPVRDAHKG